MAVPFGTSGHTVSLLAVTVVLVLECSTGGALFNVSLDLQGDCSGQLTLICGHDDILSDPSWIHNGTVKGGELLTTAFPGLTMYSFQNSTEHRVTVTGVDDVTALDGYVFQCAYNILGTPIKSNAVQYTFVPNDIASPPTFTCVVVNGTIATASWHHTDKGPCFTNLTFSYNITWYAVVGGVPQREEEQSGVTVPSATAYTITNLMNGTDYQVELFGFTPSDPVVYSEVATVNFTTEVPCANPTVTSAPSNPMVSQEVFTGVVYSLTALYIVSMTIFGGITAVLCWKIHTLKQKGNPTPSNDPTPSDDPTPSGDPTSSGAPTSIQLQPNPSYCSVEMSHQQLMSSWLENECK